jgi:hypothetical protein
LTHQTVETVSSKQQVSKPWHGGNVSLTKTQFYTEA